MSLIILLTTALVTLTITSCVKYLSMVIYIYIYIYIRVQKVQWGTLLCKSVGRRALDQSITEHGLRRHHFEPSRTVTVWERSGCLSETVMDCRLDHYLVHDSRIVDNRLDAQICVPAFSPSVSPCLTSYAMCYSCAPTWNESSGSRIIPSGFFHLFCGGGCFVFFNHMDIPKQVTFTPENGVCLYVSCCFRLLLFLRAADFNHIQRNDLKSVRERLLKDSRHPTEEFNKQN